VVKVNSGQGDDQVLGKATRKLFKAVYEQITGSPSGDDGDVDEIGGVIEASAKVVPEAPPVGRIASQPSNGGQPRGPECKAEWDTLHKFSDAYGDEIINEARYDAGYSEVAIAACNARQLSAIINKLVEWETNRKLSKQEKEPAVAGKSGGKKDMF
jgi:hypothetical protein